MTFHPSKYSLTLLAAATFIAAPALAQDAPTEAAPAEAAPAEAAPAEAEPTEAAPAEAAPAEAAPAEAAPAEARTLDGEALYAELSDAARGEGPAPLFDALRSAASTLSWEGAEQLSFPGNLRRLEIGGEEGRFFYLLRARTGELHVLALPAEPAAVEKGSTSPYADLAGMIKNKMNFPVERSFETVEGVRYSFVRLSEAPTRSALDRLFFIAIVLLLFLTMVGMGLTLTVADFALVFKKPLGVIIGFLAQFGLMPLLAVGLGMLVGFYDEYPFIYLGMILIAATPGGVTSNLMTYLGKGDVALSVSLTAICTVGALVFTPLLLTVYGGNLPAFTLPVAEIFKTMLVLVVVPLGVGMLLRAKTPRFAARAEKPFAALGVLALLFLIVVGIWSNLDQFADTERYGLRFYVSVFVLTLAGMFFGGGFAKLARVSNFQVRAISLEVGLRNASLAMTIAILLQDRIGDFASSMFFTSGIFGIAMYFAGALSIWGFKIVLPVEATTEESPASG